MYSDRFEDHNNSQNWSIDKSFLRSFSEINTSAQFCWIAIDWLLVFALVMFHNKFQNGFSYLLTVLLIASRQHALLVLAHDCAHYRMASNKSINDLLGNFFCSFPCLIGVDAYRTHHWNHHRYLNTEKDPDWARKSQLSEWQFPMRQIQLFKIIGSQLLRGGWEWILLSFTINRLNGAQKKVYQKEGVGVIAWWIAAIITFSYFNLILEFFIYWVVPLLTVMPLLQRFRSITEHFALPQKSQFSSSRITKANFFEEFLISPHSVNYHLVHHLFPSVPHYHIKKVFQILQEDPTFAKYAHINHSFFVGKSATWLDLIDIKDKIKLQETA